MTRLRNIAGDWRDWRIWIEADSTLYGIRDEEIRRIKDVQSKNEMNVRYEA